MTLMTWGPALEAEIAYRQERARLAWPQRRSAPRRGRPAEAGNARPGTPEPTSQSDDAPPAPAPLRALAGGGARRRSLPGSEAWPAA